MRRIALLTALVASVSGIGFAMSRSSARPGTATVVASSSAPSVVPKAGGPAAAEHPGLRWTLGASYTYESAYAYELRAADGDRSPTSMTARGKLAITVVGVASDEVTLCMELRDVTRTSSSPAEERCRIEAASLDL